MNKESTILSRHEMHARPYIGSRNARATTYQDKQNIGTKAPQ